MGALGGMLGLNGGAGGTGFNISGGPTGGQLGQAAGQVNSAINQQQNLLNALQGQNALQNQSNVYNQLQQVASGQGPNPAQAQLAQATGANVANQAALMAGQRGAGSNVGLMARQAAQQGAQTQQQAAGQAANLQAQQSLNAIGAAGNMANTQAGQLVGGIQGLGQMAQNNQGQLLQSQAAQNQVQGGMAQTTMGNQAALIGGGMNAAGAAMGAAKGGSIGYADGGVTPGAMVAPSSGPQSSLGQYLNFQMSGQLPQTEAADLSKAGQNFGAGLKNQFSSSGSSSPQTFPTGTATQKGATMPMERAKGGLVKALVSPGELFLDPKDVKNVAEGKAKASQVGEKIPGQAKVKGDSYKNDTVPAKLPAGGFVVKRTALQSPNPDRSAAAFVRASLAHKRKK